VPDGYACVRVDSRGAGRSPGVLDPLSPRETKDLYECIEWAGTQAWSTGKVGLAGISYYAINQWVVAAMQPPHLAAMCPWEGAADWYRDMTHHGGIVSTFFANWFDKQVVVVQHGLGERGFRSPITGEPVAGPETLSDEELEANRAPFGEEIRAHPLDDDYHRSRTPDWSKVTVPMLSCGNWGGQGLHLRGNVEGYVRAASEQKWLEIHGIEHWTEFYTDYGVALQKRFFAAFLKGETEAWAAQPPVQLQVRHHDRFVQRGEQEWPLARTRWTRMHLDAADRTLATDAPATEGAVDIEALGDGVTFMGPPLEDDLEITGPVAARLHVSSSTEDADLFLVLRAFDPDGQELVFQGALDPHTPIGQGWLRLSHRALDPELSEEYRPYHRHDREELVTPGEIHAVDVELWPTSIVLPPGYRLGLTVRGSDYVYDGPGGGARLGSFKNEMTGCGPFLHDDPNDRPPERFGGTTTLHTGGDREAFALLPIIPSEESGR
jgi:predicted acyl esterase